MIVNVLLAVFFVLILYCFVKNHILQKSDNYIFMSKDTTGALRGVAILAIAFSHICQAEPVLKETLLGGKYMYTIVFSWGGIGVAIFFLLSGYGCFLSINRSDNNLKWLIKHVVKMVIYFVITFLFGILVRKLVLGEILDFKECLESFVTLRLPGTSSWYLKIQLLFYLLLAISDRIKKNQCFIVSALVLTYATIARMGGLPDYWWKTSMCFAVGCVIAKYKDIVSDYVQKLWVKAIIILAGLASFVYTRIDFYYILIPQLIAYVCIVGCIVLVWDWLGGKNSIFDKIGKASLAIYLIHIGVVDTVYILPYDTNVKTIIFIGIVAMGTLTSYVLSEKSNGLLTRKFK